MPEHAALTAHEAHGGAEHRFADLQEQFDDMTQQRQSATLGMWAFLATEVLMFGALFIAYTVYRTQYGDTFREAGHHLYMSIGAINTAVLLTSSFFVALAVWAAQTNRPKGVFWFLMGAIALGLLFLVFKAIEYYLDYEENLVPWLNFVWHGEHASRARLFFVFYFIMTAIHALHMVIGIGLLGWIARQGLRGRYNEHYHTPVELSGLYWHFVDIVWIFLFPTFYLTSHV